MAKANRDDSSPAPGRTKEVYTTLSEGALAIRLTLQEFSTPPMRDALVLGKRSPIGCIAIRKALSLLLTSPFAHIEFDDDVISDILVRETVLRIVGREKLINLVLQHIKCLMTDTEIMHLDIEAKLHIDVEV